MLRAYGIPADAAEAARAEVDGARVAGDAADGGAASAETSPPVNGAASPWGAGSVQ
jgi:hypothetical protein